jgi:alpha-N-arabinofuranosidase
MANVAQLCNNLHSLYLAGEHNFVETPNYFVFDMFKTHQGAKQVQVIDDFEMMEVKDRAAVKSVSSSASVNENGDITLTLVNLDYAGEKQVRLSSFGGEITGQANITVLTADDPRAHNSFENPKAVQPVTYNMTIKSNDTITLPKSSVVSVVIAEN